MPIRSSQAILLAILCCSPSRGEASEPSAIEFFEKEVRPLLAENCVECHGGAKPKGGLRLTSRADIFRGGRRGPAVVAGNPDDSLLLRAVRYEDKLRMPPGGKLTDRQIESLARWVRQGAPWPGTQEKAPADGRFAITDKHRTFWSFQPVRQPPVPDVRGLPSEIRTPLDAFIATKLRESGLTLAPEADRRTLLRRVTFDLIGLPPTPEEIDAFIQDDSPQVFARVVDRLLGDPRYGERWGRHWLDVVRYADARDLIQLPPASDFREAWRYRDWVVDSFNRDLPYADFIGHQIAGDLLPPSTQGGIQRDGIIATGLLAIADFVPGDVDKDLMIADYVHDQIDVVGKAFLGLTLACARCHDHKFDPIATEDYYALAGIFFSTRLIPGPVPGNTPLVRVPLTSPAELAQHAADQRRRTELEQQIPQSVEDAYLGYLKSVVVKETARYLVAACEFRNRAAVPDRAVPNNAALSTLAKRHRLHEGLLAGWVAFLGKVAEQSPASRPPIVCDAAVGKLSGSALERSAGKLQQALAALGKRSDAEPAGKNAVNRAALLRLRADDPRLRTDAAGRVEVWPNRAPSCADAKPPSPGEGPMKVSVKVNGHLKTVLRFDGRAMLEAPGRVPAAGSLFLVYQVAKEGPPGQRLVGWEDANVGRHGLGLMLDPSGRLQAILRNNGQASDLVDAHPVDVGPAGGFEVVSITWGKNGTMLHRNGAAAGARQGITGISSDPAIAALRIGGPGSGDSPRFCGDLAELRVFEGQLSETQRLQVETELRDAWFKPSSPEALVPRDLLDELYDELLSPHGPLWLPADERMKLLPAEVRTRLTGWQAELELLKQKPPPSAEQAVAVQEGGPPGTRHEGFKDAAIFLRGDHKRLGKTVPRGFPRVLAGERQKPITTGSGRLQLAEWLAHPDNPLTARVMVNRIWQHHFGEGLVRTPNDFGQRGERPTHPELLDYLAARFVASGGSVKAMHRLILLSSVYRQSSRADALTLARDPDNRLLGRQNRRRLEAEAIRDGLLAVAGRLDSARGGPAFTDLALPRRTLYLMSVRTGPSAADFARLFDRADPGSIVDRRGETIVAPQALFFLNDPTVSALAKELATRVARVAPTDPRARMRLLYALTLGRPPTRAEIELGEKLLTPTADADPWHRYCLLLLCTNEFVYLD